MNKSNHTKIDYKEFEAKLLNLCLHSNSDSHPEFKKSREECEAILKRIHERLVASIVSVKDLAKDVHEFSEISGAPLEEIAKQFSKATERIYSKSHVSKLSKVGNALNAIPILDEVSDFENLNLLSSIPTNELKEILKSHSYLLKMPRKSLKRELRRLFPMKFKIRPPKPVLSESELWTPDTLKAALLNALDHLRDGDQELRIAVESCLSVISESRSESFACETHSNT